MDSPVLVNVVTVLNKLAEAGIEAGIGYKREHVVFYSDHVVFEWWCDHRKLTILVEDTKASFIRVWGPDIRAQMHDVAVSFSGEATPNLDEFAMAWIWLWRGVRPSIDYLIESWHRETGFLSSITQMQNHWAYQELKDYGASVIPAVLRDLNKRPSHLFNLIRDLTGYDADAHVPDGKVSEQVEAWLAWGRLNSI